MNIKKPLIINFLAGPGNLKSGTAAGVFSLLKLHYVACELVQEYPKDLTWEENWKLLGLQDFVFGEQNRRIARIGDAVDVIVTDTSLLYSLVYRREALTPEFENYVMSIYNSYNNLNIFFNRNDSAEYEEFGRIQSKSESIDIDNIVKSILEQHKIDHIRLDPGRDAINKVTSIILKMFNKDLTFTIK